MPLKTWTPDASLAPNTWPLAVGTGSSNVSANDADATKAKADKVNATAQNRRILIMHSLHLPRRKGAAVILKLLTEPQYHLATDGVTAHGTAGIIAIGRSCVQYIVQIGEYAHTRTGEPVARHIVGDVQIGVVKRTHMLDARRTARPRKIVGKVGICDRIGMAKLD